MALPPGYSRFFIGLLPPLAVQHYANQVVRELGDRYQTRAAQAPPHITLFPPFAWPTATLSEVEQALGSFALTQAPIPVSLSGFGAFPPRVLYIHVVKRAELLALQAHLLAHLAATLELVDPQSQTRPFTPHVTVASRNIPRSTFKRAWAELQPRSVEFEFVSDRLTLLIHDGHRWQIQSEFPLIGSTASPSAPE